MKHNLIDDTHTFEEFGFIPLFPQTQPKIGDLSKTAIDLPEKIGEWYFGSKIGSKSFDVPLILSEQNDILKEDKIDKLLAFLLDKYGKPRKVKLNFRRNGKKFIYAYLSDVKEPEYDQNNVKYVLSFYQPLPFKYALSSAYDPDSIPIYGQAKTGDYYKNTQSFQWIYSRHYSGIHNYSSLITDIDMTIVGTLKNASVTQIQSNTKLTLPDINNQTLKILSSNYDLTVNGKDTITTSNLNFFHLEPGDNGFLFEADVSNAKVTFDWHHHF